MGKVESISLNVNPEATPAILVKSGYHGPSGTFPNILKRPTKATLPYGRSFLDFLSPLLLYILLFSIRNFSLYN